MRRSTKITMTVAAAAVAGTAIVLASQLMPAGSSAGSTDDPPTNPSTAAPETTVPNAYNPGKPSSCDTWSAIRFDPREENETSTRVWLEGPELTDTGPLDLAAGDVTLDHDGNLATYTVAAGDSGLAIGERFCVDYITVFQFNHIYPQPHPGDVLALRVDPSVPFPVDPIDSP